MHHPASLTRPRRPQRAGWRRPYDARSPGGRLSDMDNEDNELLGFFRESVAWNNFTASQAAGTLASDDQYLPDLATRLFAAVRPLTPTETVYRARIMPVDHQFDDEPLPLAEMGPPPASTARKNRLSPKEKPVLYAALDIETAIAEVRPWRKARISVARFVATEVLRVADLTSAGANGPDDLRVRWVSYMLSVPAHEEDEAAYAGSQALAGALESAGVDGVLYQSSLRPQGVNLAVFGPAALSAKEAELYEIVDVGYASLRLYPPEHHPLRGIGEKLVG